MTFRLKHIRVLPILIGVFVCSAYMMPVDGGLKAGFQALQIHDYFKARKVFLKKRKAHPAAANFGLSVVSGRSNNPFFDLDSSYTYIQRSKIAFGVLTETKRVKLNVHGVDSAAILEQERLVRLTAWQQLKSRPASISDLDHYIAFFGASAFQDSAIWARSGAAFQLAREADTQQAYLDFMSTYPDATETVEARNRLEEVRFRDYTASGDLEGNLKYLTDFGASRYAPQAEDNIYRLIVPEGTQAQLRQFIRTYPSNRNVPKAWRALYKHETLGAGYGSIARFKENYPDYPFLDELSVDLETAGRELYPFVQEELWGFVDRDGEIRVPASYDWVEDFDGPQAIVAKEDRVGTIDRAGQVVIPLYFDGIEELSAAYAVAEQGGNLGLIDRRGKAIIPFKYEDLSMPRDGLVYAAKQGKYGYLDLTGKVVIPFVYEDAREFINGRAITDKEGALGMIDRMGAEIIPHQYQFLEQYRGNFARAKDSSYFLLLDEFGNEHLEGAYTHIGAFSGSNGLALVLDETNKVGYADTLGNIAIPVQYEADAGVYEDALFKNGYAVVLNNKKKYGLIGTNGSQILPFQYTWIGEVRDGLVSVEKTKGKRYIVNLDEERINSAFYDWVWPFENGYAHAVDVEGAHLLVQVDGEELNFTNCTGFKHVENGHVVVKVNDKYGLYTLTNEVVLDSVYTDCTPIGKDLWQVEADEKRAFFRTDLRKFVWIQAGFPLVVEFNE